MADESVIPGFVYADTLPVYADATSETIYCQNRYGRDVAKLVNADEEWLQEQWVREGKALVYAPDCVLDEDMKVLLEAESQARENQEGLWQDNVVTIAHEQADEHYDAFKRVGGLVTNVASTKYGTYINFGEDWKTDFTGYIPKGSLQYFSEIDLASMIGQFVYLRGAIYPYHGPRITLFHPSQVEIINGPNR